MLRGPFFRWCLVALWIVLPGMVPVPLAAQVSARQYREAKGRLSDAIREGDSEAFLEALAVVLERDDRSGVQDAVEAYERLAAKLEGNQRLEEFYYLHNKTAAAFSSVSRKPALREIERLRAKGGTWRRRLLLLDAASFNEKLDLESFCIAALKDSSPVVIRRALQYLARDRKVPIVEAIVERFVELETRIREKRKNDPQWVRTLYAYRSTLERLLHVDLPAAIDWKNYLEVRKGSSDLFKRPGERQQGRTALTLFGTEVTGKNILFILDTSGSMRTTDPVPEEERKGRGGRTVVGDPEKRSRRPKVDERRRRITRARKELNRVIRALPEGVIFNLIAFSSDVTSWKRSMVRATSQNKKMATQFVDGLEAEGITVTDLALEEAFSDLNLDTIYLITDGAPTHVGSTGRDLPEDAREIIAAIHERLRVLNFLRGVRIFSLGFRGAEEDFLKKLSRDNSGRYVRIR